MVLGVGLLAAPGGAPPQFWAALGLALLFAVLGLAGIAAAPFLAALAGLLLRPARPYAGLVRR